MTTTPKKELGIMCVFLVMPVNLQPTERHAFAGRETHCAVLCCASSRDSVGTKAQPKTTLSGASWLRYVTACFPLNALLSGC